MKKYIILFFLLLVVAKTSAQEKENSRGGHLSTELQFNPFSNDFKTFKMGELKFRYFVNDNSAIRFAIGLGMDNSTETTTNDFDNKINYNTNNYRITTDKTDITTNRYSLKLTAGYEHHIDVIDRLSVYIGGEAGYEARFYSGEKKVDRSSDSYKKETNTWTDYSQRPYTTKEYAVVYEEHSTTTGTYKYKKCTPNGNESNSYTIMANLFTGVDFMLYRGLYIGTELGLSFKLGKNENGTYEYDLETKGKYSTTYTGSTPSDYKNTSDSYTSYDKFDSSTGIREQKTTYSGRTSQNGPEYSVQTVTNQTSKYSNLSLYVQPALRIGWRF